MVEKNIEGINSGECEQKLYIKIDDKYLEIVDGVEYEISPNQAKELGFDENSAAGDDDDNER
ncbi:hypothetical protein [Aquamicrobium sp.]|uniref:hypothetical protein n=1 Tax=Aquamicrobium sp. TaxID=1872579 RepID=UPI002584AA63|nr:hypothetical protein [Aquamicrobium sp.]MCK9550438.1 hypothetical protein [Aquamicrobium sp.]